jgi:hypothetical protein
VCFVWSTLPSSLAISGGKYCSRIYENKYKVDEYMRQVDMSGPFFYTGNFFENSVLRGHVKIGADGNLEFKQPVILEDTECISLPSSWVLVLMCSGDVVCGKRSFAMC